MTGQSHASTSRQPDLFTHERASSADVGQTDDVENSVSQSATAPAATPSERKSVQPDVRSGRVRRSMLWSAYGDALGFISELVDSRRLMRRTSGAPLDRLMEWEHRVGGRWGVNVTLPTGCWSDDTQLRMAVSRSIGPGGFDVETFARVELPVWPSYALGGGRASKAAAKNLSKPTTPWYANTFPRWVDAGGNGTAMRIQPHVWASPCTDSGTTTLAVPLNDGVVLDVIADSVCTHGHPRAIVGACFHAATLAHCLASGSVPDANDCMSIADGIRSVARLIEGHQRLGGIWMGLWEQETGQQFHDQWLVTVDELRAAINETMGNATTQRHRATDTTEQSTAAGRAGAAGLSTPAASELDEAYTSMINRLGLRAGHQRGSAILTTVAAVALAATARDTHRSVVAAANAIGTDTDTIATMTGALLGACDGVGDPPEDPLDKDFLLQEADRLSALSRGEQTEMYNYPDLLTWVAPKNQADTLVSHNGSLAVEGLGPAATLNAEAVYTPRRDFAWQWVKTLFGQTLLVKRRPEIKPLRSRNDPTPPPAPRNMPRARRAAGNPRSRDHTSRSCSVSERTPRNTRNGRWRTPKAIAYAKRQTSDDKKMGALTRRVAQEGTRGDFLTVMRELYDELQH